MGYSIDAKSFISYRNAKVLVSLFVLISLTITLLFRENTAFRTVFGDVSVTVASCFGAAGMFYALLNAGKQEKNVRITLILMVSGLLFNVLAEIVWTILDIVLHEQPFPSLADGFYLMFYPLFTLGIMFLPADRLSVRERNKIIIDIVIILAAAVLIFWDLIIAPILKNGGESPLALALSVAYPILDIVLLFALLELLYRRWNSLHLGPLFFMLAAIVAAIASDISFSMESSAETYVSGGLVDLGFMLSYCFFGLAGVYQAENWRLSPKSTSERTGYDQSAWTRYLPYTGVGVAYLLLIWDQARLLPVDLSITTWGVGGIIGLVLVRQIMALNENNSLLIETKIENEERKAAEEASRVSEAKYRAIFENTGTVMLIVEEDTTISLANVEFEKLTGYTRKETEGKKSWTEFVVKDDLERMISQHRLRRQNPDAALKTYEFRLLNKNGQIKDILLTVDVISGTRKSVASLMDISERKRAEERLASLLRFHNEMLDTAAIWIDMFDAKGCTTFWNLAAERISGYTRDEVLGHSRIWEWLYPDPEYRSRMIDTVKGMLIRNERIENYETVIRRKDGEERTIRWHSNNFIDKEGKILGGIGIGDDITERKRSSEALKDSERRLSDIIDFLPDATFVIDRNGKVISWNRAIEAMTGIEAKDILGKGDYEYAVPFYGIRKPILIDLVLKSNEEIERSYSNKERKGGILVGEAYMPNLKGSEAYLSGTAIALCDYRGNIVGAIESIRDITERKRIEKALLESEELYRAFFKTSRDCVFITSVDGRWVDTNDAAVQFFGYDSREDLLNAEIKDLYANSEERKRHLQVINEKGYTQEYPVTLQRKDGTIMDTLITSVTRKDRIGEIIGYQGTIRDITERKRAEEALRESEEKYRNLVERANDGIIIIQDGLIKYANSRSGMIWDSTVEEIVGKSFIDYIYPNEIPLIVERYRRRMKNEYVEPTYETILRRKNGTKIFVELNAGLITFLGKPADLVIVRDITERKQAEEALRKSEQSYRLLAENVTDVIWTMDLNMKFVYISPSNVRMTGFGIEEMMTMTLEEVLTPSSLEIAKRTLAEELENEKISQKDKFRSRTIELEENCRDGHTIWVEVKTTFLRDEKGLPIGIQGVSRDITERKRTEEALRASNQIIEGIINAIPVRVFWKDRDLVYLGCNAIFAQDAGFADPKDVVGKDDYQMGWRDQAELYRGDDRQVIESDRSKLLIEEPQTTPEGKTIVLLTSKIPLRSSDGEIIGVLGTYTDITERKQMEEDLRRSRDELEERVRRRTTELESKNTEMERFIYTVSHDLRTPLISVSGFLGFLKQDAERGDLEQMNADLRIANEAITKMDRLLLETLELSRIGRVVNPPEDVPFREIVEDALGQTDEKIRSSGCKVSVAQNLPVVHVDRMRITEVLVNLIENSIKYMGLQANPEIEIGQRIDGKDRIFFVRDNGIGIDPSQHDKVFGLFYKVDRKSEGTGAGLAIVKRIIEVHSGRIWIESGLGKGCTVCFTLPLGMNSASSQ